MAETSKIFKERALWIGSVLILMALGYVITGLETAKMNLSDLKNNQAADKIQWAKISMMREDYWKSQVKQAYKNGCMETAINYLRKEIK